DLMAIYNAKLNFQKDSYAYGEAFDTNVFLRVDNAQAAVEGSLTASAVYAVNTFLSSRDREKDILNLDPNWEFWGNAENKLWINVPTFDTIDIAADATYENVATLLFTGFTVVGAAAQ